MVGSELLQAAPEAVWSLVAADREGHLRRKVVVRFRIRGFLVKHRLCSGVWIERWAPDSVALEGCGVRQEDIGGKQSAARVPEEHRVIEGDGISLLHPRLQLVGEEREKAIGPAGQS